MFREEDIGFLIVEHSITDESERKHSPRVVPLVGAGRTLEALAILWFGLFRPIREGDL